MIPIFITSNTPSAGRTFLALGLALKLQDMGHRVGFLKPFGNVPVAASGDLFDADAWFLKETLGLAEPLDVISPFLATDENRTLLLQGKRGNDVRMAANALAKMKQKDFVIVCGAGGLFEGALAGLDAVTLAAAMKAPVLLVEPWRGDSSLDVLYGARSLFGERFAGGVLNKVPEAMASRLKDEVRPALEARGVHLTGIIPRDRFLESVTVASLNEALNGTVLCCGDRLDEFVEHFLVGAMDVDSAVAYFRRTPNKAVITGAHRSDIQIAALETSTKVIILTGGSQTGEAVLGKAKSRGIPILSVPDDTFTTIDKIELCMGTSSIRDARKVGRVRELVGAGFDFYGFLSRLHKA